MAGGNIGCGTQGFNVSGARLFLLPVVLPLTTDPLISARPRKGGILVGVLTSPA